MEKKNFLFWFSLIAVLVIAAVVIVLNSNRSTYQKDIVTETDRAVAGAKAMYKRELVNGRNMQSGPCLSNDLMPGWVLDIVHSPREEIDELSENQCAAYREGRAAHIVELDTSGNLVRVR